MTDGERFIEAVREHVRTPKVIVEVGSYRGEDAIAFAAAFPEAKVFAVDPVNLDVDACMAAGVCPVVGVAGKVNGPVRLFLEDDSRLNSMYKRGVNPRGETVVPSFTIDSVTFPDAIKIDAEGAAWNVLKGAPVALSHARLVQIETETEAFFEGQHLEDDCFLILAKAGFKKVWEERAIITVIGEQTESIWVRP